MKLEDAMVLRARLAARGVPQPDLNIIPARVPARPMAIQAASRPAGDGRLPEDRLNKTERAFLAYLKTQDYRTIHVQEITLKLGWDTRYTPDFATIDAENRVTLWEVKGFMRDDARVKLFAAASKYRQWRFMLVRREAGQWRIEQVRV